VSERLLDLDVRITATGNFTCGGVL